MHPTCKKGALPICLTGFSELKINTDAGKPCHLLEKLPIELLEAISELAFTPEYVSTPQDPKASPREAEAAVDPPSPITGVNLLTASLPSPSLLLTCRAIYASKARDFYREARRSYWTTKPFVLLEDYRLTPALGRNFMEHIPPAIQALRDEDLERITDLTILYPDPCRLVDRRGGWVANDKWSKSGLSHFEVRVRRTVASYDKLYCKNWANRERLVGIGLEVPERRASLKEQIAFVSGAWGGSTDVTPGASLQNRMTASLMGDWLEEEMRLLEHAGEDDS